MKYLITGLGNPGAEYADTRHNIGFMVVDALAAAHKGEFAQDRHGHICTLKIKGRQIILLKPNTYMNLSGKAVRYHLTAHEIQQENLLVITDDLNLPFGKIRLRGSGSAGGHNGLTDVQGTLGNDNYARLRMGVGSEFRKGAQVDYVLSPFSIEELPLLKEFTNRAANAVESFVFQGLSRTMTQFNK